MFSSSCYQPGWQPDCSNQELGKWTSGNDIKERLPLNLTSNNPTMFLPLALQLKF
jgi:hypothetical protein